MKRRATLILAVVDFAIWALLAVYLVLSRTDPATRGLDLAAAGAVTVLLLLTALPAVLLVRAGGSLNTALALAIAFPAAFLLIFALVVARLP